MSATSPDTPPLDCDDIKQKDWWQGSVISSSALAPLSDICNDSEYWVIASQTCNVQSHSLQSVPRIELIAAKKIDELSVSFTKGAHPRTLHVQAATGSNLCFFEIDIQIRIWLPREHLNSLAGPDFQLRDASREARKGVKAEPWDEVLAGWLARSYTRVALPDAFNAALEESKLRGVLEDKLSKRGDALHGIYLSIGADDESYNGPLGLMPPPYDVGITLAVMEDEKTSELRDELLRHIFTEKHPHPDFKDDRSRDETRAERAKRCGLRILKIGVEARPVTDITLHDLKTMTRYTMVDHLSQSTALSE